MRRGLALLLALGPWLPYTCLGPRAWQTLPVEVPVSPWPGHGLFFLAAHQGYGQANGLDLRIRAFPDPQAIVHAYLRGELTTAQLTTVEVVDICSRMPERCPVVVLVLDESRGADVIAARAPLQSLVELRGRKVAITYSTLGPYVLSRALAQVGLHLNDVTLQGMPMAAMPLALARGEVDAAAFFPPYSTQASRHTNVRVLFDSRRLPGEIFDVFVVDPVYLQGHRPALVRLLRSWQQALAYSLREPLQADALMARRAGLSLEEFRQARKGLRMVPLVQQRVLLAPGGLIARNLRAVQAVQQQLGIVAPGSPLPVVQVGPLQEALAGGTS